MKRKFPHSDRTRQCGRVGQKRSLKANDELTQIGNAIRRGEIDAFVIEGGRESRIVTLQDTENPYRVLADSVNDGTATLDSEGTILYVNPQFAKMLGSSADKLLGTPLPSHFSGRVRGNMGLLLRTESEAARKRDIALVSKEGKKRVVRFTFTPVRHAKLRCICVVASELTDLIEARGALRSNEESLRQLSSRLLRLQDDERRRIARDLHDITGQKVALQSINLSQLLRKSAGWDQESRSALTECAEMAKQISNEIRTLSYMLHPPLLDELGLTSGVKWYVEGFQRRTGIVVDVSVAPDFQRLPPDVELTLFRIVQESLTNVQRYSGSAKANVRIGSARDHVSIEIEDFGKGIQSVGQPGGRTGENAAPIGVGIQGMKERMRQLAGQLEIVSFPNQGTRVIAKLPISFPESKTTQSTAAVQPRSEPTRSARRAKRILIADDHETLRKGLRTMLETCKEWTVCGEAIDGEDAVKQAVRLRPDLLILDVNMPGLDGLAVLRKLLHLIPQLKILIFTVHDSAQIMSEFHAAGAHGYLAKNRAGEELVGKVKALLADPKSGLAAAANA